MDQVDYTMQQGDGKTLSITVLDDDENPVDLTSADITFVVSKAPGSVAQIVKVTPDHIESADPETGVFTVPLDPEDTENMAAGAYYYEAEVIDSDGLSSTVLSGRFVLLASSILPA
jgi:hypothetical protein